DGFDRARLAVLARGNFCARLDAPLCRADAVTNAGVQRAVVAEREYGRRAAGRAFAAEEGHPYPAAAGVLIDEQAQPETGRLHGRLQGGALFAALEEEAAGARAQRVQEAIKRRLTQSAIGRGHGDAGSDLVESGVQLEIAEVADGHDASWRRTFVGLRINPF